MQWINNFSITTVVFEQFLSCEKCLRQGSSFSKLYVIRKIYKENYVLCLGLACPEGWVENGNQCYSILPGKKEAFVGFYLCKQLGATLPIIKSAEQNAFLLSLMEGKDDPRLGMIAPNGDNVFEWLDGTAVADTFSAWNTGEPNGPGSENCGHLYVSGSAKGKWNDDSCSNSRHIVCQMEKKWVWPKVAVKLLKL